MEKRISNTIDWNIYFPYFKETEFTCRCGCNSNNMRVAHLDKLLYARKLADIPFVISSGFRCFAHNAAVSGSNMSDHLTGDGTDIHCTSSTQRWIIINGLLGAGFKRIGIAKSFIHAGTGTHNGNNVIWVY